MGVARQRGLAGQEWSKFGQVRIGIDDTSNPRSLTTDLDFKDTWHVALGAQYRIDDPWTLNFGVAYDSEFQDNSEISLLLPVNSAWRFGLGAQRQTNENFFWGVAAGVMKIAPNAPKKILREIFRWKNLYKEFQKITSI